MSKFKIKKGISVAVGIMMVMASLTGCAQSPSSEKVEIDTGFLQTGSGRGF